VTAATKPISASVSTALEDPQWDKFLERAGDNHHLQTSRWAKLKSGTGWQVLRLILRNDDQILGGLQILYRSIPMVGRMGYAPRGPVMSDSDNTLCKHLFSELERVIRSEHFVCLMIQPPAGATQCVALLLARGFNPIPIQVAPTATLLIDLRQSPSEWLAAMRKSTRRSIRISLSSGLTIRIGSEVDLPAFHSMLQETGARQGFTPQPLDYYRRLWQLFAPDGHVVIFLAEFQSEVVAAELDIAFGDTLVSKRAGWSGRHRKLHPNEGLVWAALNWAKNQGYKY
jgi:lipid II:glycine glycyltransferase (peptidoglycan interpeptide bridge formation enzyme)